MTHQYEDCGTCDQCKAVLAECSWWRERHHFFKKISRWLQAKPPYYLDESDVFYIQEVYEVGDCEND